MLSVIAVDGNEEGWMSHCGVSVSSSLCFVVRCAQP